METTLFPNTHHTPRVPPYSASNKKSFAYKSVTQRWPKILTQIIDHLVYQNNLLLDNNNNNNNNNQKLIRGKFIISQLSELKYEAARDKELKLLDTSSHYSEQENLTINLYNNEILKSKAAGKPTWFTASWLLTECYLINNFFNQSIEWKGFDPFKQQKMNTFKSSWEAVSSLCSSLEKILSFQQPQQEEDSNNNDDDLKFLKIQFNQFLNACLWGNATDLSLLPNMTETEIKNLQKNASIMNQNNKNNEKILRDDTDLVWESCFLNDETFLYCFLTKSNNNNKKKRIDFVLDNSGFELFTDFILADWIVSKSNQTIEIVFHPKLIPWFVSDVMKKDIEQLIESMINPTEFFNLITCNPTTTTTTTNDNNNNNSNIIIKDDQEFMIKLVKKMGLKWKSYFDIGVWKVANPQLLSFWTNPLPFWDITSRDEVLLNQLKSSNLVIFKGDLNYRKLTGDAEWETSTNFEEAIGPLNGQFNLLSLRTCKADVCVGLQPGHADKLYKIDPDWRVNGKFGLITFSPVKK